MKARKKAGIIEVQQFQPDQPWLVNVRMGDGGTYAVWNELHKSEIQIKPGDYVRVDNPGDTYPIDAKYFAENYEEVRDLGERLASE